MSVTSCPGLLVPYLISPSIIAGGLLMFRLGTKVYPPTCPAQNGGKEAWGSSMDSVFLEGSQAQG